MFVTNFLQYCWDGFQLQHRGIISHDPAMRELNRTQGRIVIPYDARPNHPSRENRMLPPKINTHFSHSRQASFLDPSSKLKSFARFPDLPLELRQLIWRETFPGRRIVKINSYGTVKQNSYTFHAFFSTAPIPIALSINSESRAEALRHYHPSFGMHSAAIPSIIYFNPSLDTLYFEFDAYQALNSQLLLLALSDRYGQVAGRVGMKDVQSVGVSHRIGLRKLGMLLDYMVRFEGLREFVVGAERESPPVADEAYLEESEEGDESLSGIRGLLDERMEGWRSVWCEERKWQGEMGAPDLKIMEVRPFGKERILA